MINQKFRPFMVKIICAGILLFSLGSFLYTAVIRGLEIAPDVYYYFAAGQLWNEGSNPYETEIFRTRLTSLGGEENAKLYQNGYAYPPSASIIFSLYARASIDSAYPLILAGYILALVLVFFVLAYIMSWYIPVGLLEVTFLIFLLANTSFGRGNVRAANLGILIGLCIFPMYILVRKQRPGLAGFLLALTSVKPTFAPWYLVYYFLRRKFRLIIVCMITIGVITIIPLVLTGRPIVESLKQMAQKMSQLNVPGDVNDLSPFIPGSALMIHLQPLVNRLLNTEGLFPTAVTWGTILLVSVYVGYLIWKTRDTGGADSWINFSLVSAISLMGIYHRNYDLFLLFPALICVYLHIKQLPSGAAKRNWIIFLAVVIIVLSMPRDIISNLSYAQPSVNDSYIMRILSPYQIWATVAAIAATIWIKRKQVVEAHQYDFPPRSTSVSTVSDQKRNPDAIKVAG
ncbi:MAG: DUF2029 domain-containing protein [Anaerolineaceae bacterium]|nr:DUF2029 domain-containing protein [Anaerolineaceae bacterium]